MQNVIWDAFQDELDKIASMAGYKGGKAAIMSRAKSGRGVSPKTKARMEHFRSGAGAGEQSQRAHVMRGAAVQQRKTPAPVVRRIAAGPQTARQPATAVA